MDYILMKNCIRKKNKQFQYLHFSLPQIRLTMRKFILILTILVTNFVYSQSKELEQMYGDFKITSIDSTAYYFLYRAVDTSNTDVMILAKKLKKKEVKLNKHSSSYKIKVGGIYKLNLISMTTSIGYLPTSNINIDGEIIWERDKSKYYVFETKSLKGLYYHF